MREIAAKANVWPGWLECPEGALTVHPNILERGRGVFGSTVTCNSFHTSLLIEPRCSILVL